MCASLVIARLAVTNMETPVTRRHRMSAGERKAAIVEAAVRLFAEKGFGGTTTRELAAAVGVSEPVLYQHFATKRDLYDAIIESISKVQHMEADVLLEEARAAEDDQAFFTRLGELMLEWLVDQPRSIRLLLFSALEGHELSELFYERRMVSFYTMLTDYIRRRMDREAFRKVDPYLAARAYTGMIAHQGMAITVFGLDDLQGSRREVVGNIVNIFLNGMKNTRSESQ